MKPRRFFVFLLTFVLMFQSVFAFEAGAAAKYTYYQTSKKDVPIWSDCSSKSTKKKTIAKKGTVLIVASSKTNSSGNLWYKLKDGNWVFSGNVASHSHAYDSNSGGYCIADGCDFEYQLTVKLYKESKKVIVTNKDGAQIWSRPYSGNSQKIRIEKKSAALMVKAETTNERKNLWYQLEDGNWVYSGNVQPKNAEPERVSEHKHSFDSNSGGICTVEGCNYEYPLTINQYKEVKKYTVSNKDGATIWERPYSGNSKKVRLEKNGATIKVKAETTNERKNLWYQLEDGNWVYSGNVQLAKASDPTDQKLTNVQIVNAGDLANQKLINDTMQYKDYVIQQYRYWEGKTEGICDTCCMANMLNRRLALEGKFPKEKFSIERTICLVNGFELDTKLQPSDHFKKVNGKDVKQEGRFNYEFEPGHEVYDRQPYVSIGNTEYKATVLKKGKIPESKDGISKRLMELLVDHPEGVTVHMKIGKKEHAVLVTRYEMNGNQPVFWCIDPAMLSAKKLENELHYEKLTYQDEDKSTNVYLDPKYVDRIVYLNN